MGLKQLLGCAISAIVPLAFTCSLAQSANSQRQIGIYMTGEALTQDCRDFMIGRRTGHGTISQQVGGSRCYGYVTGVLDLNAEMASQVYCTPDAINANTLVEVVAKYLEDNPAQRANSGASLVMIALAKAFPCPLQ